MNTPIDYQEDKYSNIVIVPIGAGQGTAWTLAKLGHDYPFLVVEAVPEKAQAFQDDARRHGFDITFHVAATNSLAHLNLPKSAVIVVMVDSGADAADALTTLSREHPVSFQLLLALRGELFAIRGAIPSSANRTTAEFLLRAVGAASVRSESRVVFGAHASLAQRTAEPVIRHHLAALLRKDVGRLAAGIGLEGISPLQLVDVTGVRPLVVLDHRDGFAASHTLWSAVLRALVVPYGTSVAVAEVGPSDALRLHLDVSERSARRLVPRPNANLAAAAAEATAIFQRIASIGRQVLEATRSSSIESSD
jgi:hypothetical protein